MHKRVIPVVVVFILLLSGCASNQLNKSEDESQIGNEESTIVPINTPSPTHEPTQTEIPPSTETAVPPTSIPEPVCKPGFTIQDATLDLLPGYADIVQVSTALEGGTLTVVFQFKDLPPEITLNDPENEEGQYEYAWGVAIDKDNNPGTGRSAPAGRKAFDARLEAVHIKKGAEKTADIESLFQEKVATSEMQSDGNNIYEVNGSISVNQEQNTITLSGSFNDVPEDAHLVFYTMGGGYMDVICDRKP